MDEIGIPELIVQEGESMKINIYYGGRGLLEDPALYVISTITQVLTELRVNVDRYNLYEDKSAIPTLPSTLKDADGIILVVSLEWFGIGGYMQQFLDNCWLYGDQEKIKNIYMLPIVMATTYGERDAEVYLIKAWDTLGGISLNGLSAYVENHTDFETNSIYRGIIEKKAENLYRSINQTAPILPNSNAAVKDNVSKTRSIDLTPQESEQLSRFVSNDTYVKKQKQDIEELSAMFKNMLGTAEPQEKEGEFIREFRTNFYPEEGFSAKYIIIIPDRESTLSIEVTPNSIKCWYSDDTEADVVMKAETKVLKSIINGKNTFQRAFMAGEITAKGNFKTLRTLDQIFRFRY